MATYVVGDIHGNGTALEALIEDFAPGLRAGDTVVFVGDVIDRGPDSRGCVDRILRLRERGPAEVVTLLGNHEQWMLRTRSDYRRHSWLLAMEAFETIRSYSEAAAAEIREAVLRAGSRIVTESVRLPYDRFFDSMPTEHLKFFDELRTWHRTPDGLAVHGGLRLDGTPVEAQEEDDLVWGPDEFPDGYKGAEVVAYGHRGDAVAGPDGRPWPRIRANTIGLDASAHGVISAVRLPDRRVFRAEA